MDFIISFQDLHLSSFSIQKLLQLYNAKRVAFVYIDEVKHFNDLLFGDHVIDFLNHRTKLINCDRFITTLVELLKHFFSCNSRVFEVLSQTCNISFGSFVIWANSTLLVRNSSSKLSQKLLG